MCGCTFDMQWNSIFRNFRTKFLFSSKNMPCVLYLEGQKIIQLALTTESAYTQKFIQEVQYPITSSNRIYNLKRWKYWETYYPLWDTKQEENSNCVSFFLCLLQHSYVSLQNYKTAKAVPSIICKLNYASEKEKWLLLPWSPVIQGKLSPELTSKVLTELTGDDQVISPCLAAREARRRSSGIFHLYKVRLVLLTRKRGQVEDGINMSINVCKAE